MPLQAKKVVKGPQQLPELGSFDLFIYKIVNRSKRSLKFKKVVKCLKWLPELGSFDLFIYKNCKNVKKAIKGH